MRQCSAAVGVVVDAGGVAEEGGGGGGDAGEEGLLRDVFFDR